MRSSEILPKYIKSTTLFQNFIRSASQASSRVTQGDALKGGSSNQVGGEFLFEDGKVTWCRRMRDVTDHSELQKIREVLGLPVAETANEILEGTKVT